MKTKLLMLGMVLGLILACNKPETTTTPAPVQQQNPEPEPVLSSEKQMTVFRFADIENNGVTVDIPGEIDEQGKSIAVEMPSGTEITALEPDLEIPDMAVYEPTGPQDFSTPINYTVTAEDGTSRTYLVTLEVALSQKEILLLISAANPGNLLDWKETDNLSNLGGVGLDGNGDIISLSMFNKNITTLPLEIGQLSSLKLLTLSHNNLSSLPPEIGQLSSLETLKLDSNDLSSLPPEIGQLGNLKFLDLQTNILSSLPPEIGQLSSLGVLRLNVNNLSSLPPEIGQLSSLEDLRSGATNLSSLPPEIGQLSSLKSLILFKNDLSSLPIEIKQLVNLSTLNLEDNNLSQFNHVPFIPSGVIGGITPTLGCSTETNLETLRLSGNPNLEVLDQCICDLDTSKEGGTVNIDIVPDGVDCVGNVISGK